MDPVLAALLATSFGFGGAGAAAWRRVTSRWKTLDDQRMVNEQAAAAHAVQQREAVEHLARRLSSMESLLEDARSVLPDLDGAIMAHRLLAEDTVDAEALWQTLDRLVMGLPTEPEAMERAIDPMKRSTLQHLFARASTDGLPVEGQLSSSSLTQLSEAALLMGYDATAEHLLQHALLDRPGDVALHAIAERIAARRGDGAARLTHLEAQLSERPDDTDLLRRQAHLLASAGQAEAERPVRRLEALGEVTAADRSLLSGIRARAGAPEEALAEIEAALREDPSQPDDWVRRGELLEGSDVEQALSSAESCLNLDRQHGEGWALKARCLARMHGRDQEALKAATHAVALNAGGWTTIMLKADLQESIGAFTAAEEGLDRALLAHAGNAPLRAAIATRRLERGRLDDAQALLDAVPVDVDHASLHLVEGRLALARAALIRDGTGAVDGGRLREAGDAIDQALKLDRENGLAWLAMGRVQRLLGDFDAASESLTRAGRLLDEHLPALRL